MNRPEAHPPVCPLFHQAIELIGRRWTGAMLRAMQEGSTRFSDIAAHVPGISDRLLSERLRELEQEGLITRMVIPDIPVRVEYRRTAKGEALDAVFCTIAQWSHDWLAQAADAAPEPQPAPEAGIAGLEAH